MRPMVKGFVGPASPRSQLRVWRLNSLSRRWLGQVGNSGLSCPPLKLNVLALASNSRQHRSHLWARRPWEQELGEKSRGRHNNGSDVKTTKRQRPIYSFFKSVLLTSTKYRWPKLFYHLPISNLFSAPSPFPELDYHPFTSPLADSLV